MRGYVALSGREGAFGWGRKNALGGYDLSLSGLKPESRYTLDDARAVLSDARGCWQGQTEKMPRFVAEMPSGRAVLCDEARMAWEEAMLLAAPKKSKPAPPKVIQIEEKVQYRTRLHAQGVDALPVLQWPRGSESLRACFEKSKPVRVLPLPWRFAVVPGTKGQCLVGYLAKADSIIKTAYAVRAKGGLLQPKGLQGYSYVRSETGEGYWLLEKDVR